MRASARRAIGYCGVVLGLLQTIGPYQIIKPLSKGGMALVYEARKTTLEGVSLRVAIKLILPEHAESETFKDLFINEARLGSSMEHQNLVRILDFNCEKQGDKERYYLVMEYVEGLNLRKVLARCERHDVSIPVTVLAEIGRQACEGLHFAHLANDVNGQALHLVHRDIKPSNIMLTPHGGVKILDFGISKGRLREERRGSVKGTWGYMAPEQATGQGVRPVTDVFGLAIVLYELAARRPMFRDRSRDEIKRLLRDDHAARLAATLDPEYRTLIPVLVRALQRDPKGRFDGAGEFGKALAAIAGDPISAANELSTFHRRVRALDPKGRSTGAPKRMLEPEDGDGRQGNEGRREGFWASVLVGAALVGLLGYGVLQLGRTAFVELGWFQPVTEQAEAQAPPSKAVTVAVVRDEDAPVEEIPLWDEPAGPAADAQTATPTEELSGGELSLGGTPESEVWLNGQYEGKTPLRKRLPVGEYEVVLSAADGRMKRFSVVIKEGRRVSKTWDFERQKWR